jgi:hypothetical protein
MDDRNNQAQGVDQQKRATASKEGDEDEKEEPLRFPLAGRTGRLDYQLQPNVIDSEYVSAVLAHSSYFASTDVIDYTIDLTRVKATEAQPMVVDLTGSDEVAMGSI